MHFKFFSYTVVANSLSLNWLCSKRIKSIIHVYPKGNYSCLFQGLRKICIFAMVSSSRTALLRIILI